MENLLENSCRKILQEILVGKSCRKIWQKILQEKVVGNSCGKILLENGESTNKNPAQENLVGKSCRKILQENLAEKSGRTGRRGQNQFKKGSDWWKFSIWNRVMGSHPVRIQLRKVLREILQEILWKNLAGQGGGDKANLRKAVIGGNLAFGIGLLRAN